MVEGIHTFLHKNETRMLATFILLALPGFAWVHPHFLNHFREEVSNVFLPFVTGRISEEGMR